jgi:hypothetical protein
VDFFRPIAWISMTKKFVNALSRDGRANSRSRFLIPAVDGTPCFQELESGRRHVAGYIVYTGKEQSTSSVLERLKPVPNDAGNIERLIDSYLLEVAAFKVGNVVAVDSVADGYVRLRLVTQSP